MFYFINSILYFIRFVLFEKKTDVIFYYPQHFNRGNDGENLYFDHLYNSCVKYNLNYLIFEEPSKSTKFIRRNKPFDFIFYIVIILRKLRFSDRKIGSLLSKSILRGLHTRNIVVLSQSMVEFFRGLFPESNIYDVQHGIIHSKKENYFLNEAADPKLIDNNVKLIVNGKGIYELLVSSDKTNYFSENIYYIGIPNTKFDIFHVKSNNKILVTLQFTSDHTYTQNITLLNELKNFIVNYGDFTFYLKNHPRFKNEVNLDDIMNLVNVKTAPNNIIECLKICSIHLTSYSTSTFEAALCGVPTIFLNSLSEKFSMFSNDYKLDTQIKLLEMNKDYLNFSKKYIQWAKTYISDYDEKKFISLLR
tara:strand:+ start:57974 stop:59059 length:1086 start_codon:yes stop_codon:yes gene_type:complete